MPIDISVIIPVYNAVRFLETCLDSLVSQTYDHGKIEILLVDDGSDDGSERVCDQYAQDYPGLFRVIHCSHTGSPGAVRNTGMKEAAGEYILFSDADDWWGSEAIERLLRHAREWGSDMIQGRLCIVENGKVKGINKFFDSNKASVPNADWRTFQQLTSTLGTIRCFKRSLALENDIWWDDDCWFEDTLFSLKLIFASRICSVANDYNYYYVRRSDDNPSLSTTQKAPVFIKRPGNIVSSIEKLFDLYDSQRATPEEGHYLLCKLLRHQVITGSEIIVEQVGLDPDSYPKGATPYLHQVWSRAANYYTEEVKKGLSLEVRCALEGLDSEKSFDELRPLRRAASCSRLPQEVKPCEDRSIEANREEGLGFLSRSTFDELLLRQLSNVVFGMIHQVSWIDDAMVLSGDVFFPLCGTKDISIKVLLEGESGGCCLHLGEASIDYESHGEPFQARGVWTVKAAADSLLSELTKSSAWDICLLVSAGGMSRRIVYSKQNLSPFWRTGKDASLSFLVGRLWCGLLPDSNAARRIGCIDLSDAMKKASVSAHTKKKSILRVVFPTGATLVESTGIQVEVCLVDNSGKAIAVAAMNFDSKVEAMLAELKFGELLDKGVIGEGQYSIRLVMRASSGWKESFSLPFSESNPAHFINGSNFLMSGKNVRGVALVSIRRAPLLRKLRRR